jgi:uncharacterized protein DUF2341
MSDTRDNASAARRTGFWQGMSFLLVLALAGVLVWGASRPTPQPVATTSEPAAISAPKSVDQKPGSLDQRLMNRIRAWAEAHPDEFRAVIRMYEGAVACMQDPSLKRGATLEIARIQNARVTAATAALAEAKRAAGEFARDGDYDAAIALFDNIPAQFVDLIGAEAKAAGAQFAAEAESKVRAVLAVARGFGQANKPGDGLAALDRMGITYTPTLGAVQKLSTYLLARKRALDEQKRLEAVARAKTAIWALLDRIEAGAGNNLAGAVRLAEAELKDEALKPAGALLTSAAAVVRLLPAVKDQPKDWTPATPDQAVAAALLAFVARDAKAMGAALERGKGHALCDRYTLKLIGLKLEIARRPGASTRRRLIRITGAGRDLKDCPVRVLFSRTDDMRRDYTDLRFTDTDGRPLAYWIERADAVNAPVWVKIPLLPKAGTVIAVWYGDPAAKPVDNGRDVFTFFEDFEGGLDAKTWEGVQTSVKGGVLTVSGGDNNHMGWASWKQPLPNRLTIEMRLRVVRSGSVSRGHIALYPEGEKPNMRGTNLRGGLAGIAYDYDTYNGARLNINPKTFHPIPVKKGVTIGPYWNKTWFRQTIAYDGTSKKDNLRLVCDSGTERKELVHTARPTTKRVRLYMNPWCWTRSLIEVNWIAVRPYTTREPKATLGREETITPEPDPAPRG